MSLLRLIAPVFIVVVSVASGATLGPHSQYQQLFVYHQKIYATHQLLESECPTSVRIKRETFDNRTMPAHLEVAKVVYTQMLEALVECRENKTKQPFPKDCQELYEKGERNDGIYEIKPGQSTIDVFNVSCEFSDGHGWTVIHRRFNGSVSFYQSWNEYKIGFGSPVGEHWLGNEKIHALTLTNRKLNIQVKSPNNSYRIGYWQSFYIGDESKKYVLSINETGYSGNLPRGKITYHNARPFSTKDQDNDAASSSCAIDTGGWWYGSCYNVNLNGKYNDHNEWSDFSRDLVSSTMRVTRD